MNATDNYAFKPGEKMGLLASRSSPVELDIWRKVVDPFTGWTTGHVKRERMRKASEVYRDLNKHLDLVRCDKCGHERRRRRSDCCTPHEGCGGEYTWLIDEYFNGPSLGRDDFVIPPDYRHIVCFPTVGGNEGYYWHVGVFVPNPEGRGPLQYWEIAMGKTWTWARCCEMANRCATLLYGAR